MTSWRGRITDRTHWFYGNTGDDTRLMRGMQPYARLPRSAADRNRTEHTRLMHGARRESIVQRRVADIDDVHAVADSAAKTPSSPPATCGGRPAPAKAVPVRPAAASKWSPPPCITRRPNVAGAGVSDPAAIPVGIEIRFQCDSGLPHLPLPGNVVPATVGVQIGPPIAFVPRVAITSGCSV
jgi:hypothetical protein